MPNSINATFEADNARLHEEMQLLFHKTLASWASDVLRLRAEGMDRPSVRGANAPTMAWRPMRRAA